jgi:hypothetical protein
MQETALGTLSVCPVDSLAQEYGEIHMPLHRKCYIKEKEMNMTINDGNAKKVIPKYRNHKKYRGVSEFGKSTCIIECPYCGVETEAYVWSLAGCGKKCSCGAMHSSINITYEPPTVLT